MKSFLAFVFFLVFTIVLAAGIVLAATKGALWLLILGTLAYLGLCVKFGCQTH
jgi:hypothetical protein